MAWVAQEPIEYAEPFDTIGTVLVAVLLVVYLLGVPATVTVTLALWRQRTRRPSRRQPTAEPVVPPASPPRSSAATTAQALLHLQTVEREVLALRDRPAPVDDYLRLAADAAALVARHGEESTVGRYAVGLQAVVAALGPLHIPGVSPDDPPESPAAPDGSVPDRLRVGLARLAAEGRPVPDRWAFAWIGHRLDRWPAAVDHGRRAELARAFADRYRLTFSHGGLILATAATRLVLQYTPASARFRGQPVEVATDLPDVASSPDSISQLQTVINAALRDLDPPITRAGAL